MGMEWKSKEKETLTAFAGNDFSSRYYQYFLIFTLML